MLYIKLVLKTIRLEGIKKTIVRIIAYIFKLSIVGFEDEEKPFRNLNDVKKMIFIPNDFNAEKVQIMYFENEKETLRKIETCMAVTVNNYIRFLINNGVYSYSNIRKYWDTIKCFDNNDKKIEILFEEVKMKWQWEGPTDEVMEFFHILFCSNNLKAEKLSNIKLIYISSLIELGYEELAAEELIKYNKVYNDSNIHKFPPVAYLASKIGINNSKIDKSATIFKETQENDNEFENLLNLKKIAIVGSGPYEDGKNKGKEIDLHDEIIRFNNFTIEGKEGDYGERTTIWVRNFDIEDSNYTFKSKKSNLRDLKLILLVDSFYRFEILDKYLEELYEIICDTKLKIGMLKFRDEFISKSGVFPTSGALTIYNLIKRCNSFNRYYGFMFTETCLINKALNHTIDEKYSFKKSYMHHNMKLENEFMKKIVGDGQNGK